MMTTARAVSRLLLARGLARPSLSVAPLDVVTRRFGGRRSARQRTSPAMTLVAVRFIERGLDRLPGIGRSCLYRALGRYAALRAAGLDVELLVGVRSGADLIGHAWVELDGVPLWEREEPRYTVTFRTKGTRS